MRRFTILKQIFNNYNWIERRQWLTIDDIGKILLYRYWGDRSNFQIVAQPIRIFKVICAESDNISFKLALFFPNSEGTMLNTEYTIWSNSPSENVHSSEELYKLYELESIDHVLLKLELNV